MKKMIFIAAFFSLPGFFLFPFGSKEKAASPSVSPTPPPATVSAPAPATPGAVPTDLSAALTKAGIQVLKERVPIADFSLPKLSGGTVTLSELKGKVVFLNFWATWCPPCRAEMPSMEKLEGRFKSEGLEILAINLQEDEKTVGEFMKKNNLTFAVALDKAGRVGGTYGVRGIPTTYIVDRESMILGALVGGKEWDTPEVFEAFSALLRHGK